MTSLHKGIGDRNHASISSPRNNSYILRRRTADYEILTSGRITGRATDFLPGPRNHAAILAMGPDYPDFIQNDADYKEWEWRGLSKLLQS